MSFAYLVYPPAGSMSVAVVAAFIFVLQVWVSARRAEFRWYLWTAVISFSTILYTTGILLEYSAPEGPINRFGGLLEWTAVIFLVHALYGLVLSSLNVPSRRYHFIAGALHAMILVLLWSTHLFVSDHFVHRPFPTLAKPFVEADLGPLGPVFMLYALGASINAVRLWLVRGKEKGTHSCAFVWGASFWILLGAHDAAVVIGLLSFQYVMEYGFLGFSAALLYGMFSDYLRTSDALLKQSNNMLQKEMKLREQAVEALRESEKGLRTVRSIAKIGNWSWNIISGKAEWSDQAYEIFSAPHQEPSYEFAKSFVHPDDLDLWQNTVQKALEEQKPFSLDYRAVRSDGETIWVHNNTQTVFNEQGKLTGYEGTVQDITERKQAEDTLIKREKELLLISDNVPALVSYIDEAGYYRFVNKKYEEWFGIRQQDIIGKHYRTVLGVETHKLIGEKVQEAISGKRVHYEDFLPYKHGGKRYVIADYVPDTDEHGKVKGFFALVTDITDRKNAEEALSEKSVQLQHVADELELIMDTIPGLIFFKDMENRFIRTNKFAADALQMTKEQLEGRSCFELYPSKVAQAYFEDDLEVIRSCCPKLNIEEPWETMYGTRWVNTSKIPYFNEKGEVAGVIGLSLDITERKEADEALKESEQKYRNLIESLQEGIWVIDKHAKTVYVNSPMAEMLGYTEDEMTGKHLFEFMGEKYVETAKENLQHQEAGISEQLDFEFLRKDGSRVNAILVTRPLTDGKGNYDGSIAGIIDVTERKQAETALQESEEKYRSLLESTEDSIYLVDRECKYLFMNKQHFRRFMMMVVDSIDGRSYEEFHSQAETKEFRGKVNEVITTGKSDRYVYESQRDGGVYLRTLTPVKDPQGRITAVTVVSKDITEIMCAKEELRRSHRELLIEHERRKLLAGRLIELLEKDRRQTAMELHDQVGQTLTSLKSDIEMIQGKLKPEQADLTAFTASAQKGAVQAMRDIKTISRGLRPATMDALGLVSSLRELLNDVQQHADLRIHFFTHGFSGRLVPEKELGTYRIAQEGLNNIVKHAKAENVFVNLIKKGKNIELSVEDDGVGFDVETALRVGKKALTLGLLIMQERALQLGGEFNVDSRIGKGSRLMVEIPI